jgi:5-(carboxyamino)imidazole ribonucleotide synthase
MKVGIIGAGQLARMLLEDASALGIDCVVLAESPDDGAALVAHSAIIGAPSDRAALEKLADSVAITTFDHELVDLELLADLEAQGHQFAPSPSALLYAVDKAAMRTLLADHGLPIPPFDVFTPDRPFDGESVGANFGWPLVIKSARGGYDGRGVFIVDNENEANAVVGDLHEAGITVLIEALVPIRSELAALVCRAHDGSIVAWPVVETSQIAGVCREVLVPGSVRDEDRIAGEAIARQIAELVGVVGVMAVELFVTDEGLLINELAMRPHNSGHWTQNGSATSQFENHLRAVASLPLGITTTTAAAVASVNIFGGDHPSGDDEALAAALSVTGAHLHLYGKSSRPGRKLGHVNAVGTDPVAVRATAWDAATKFGSPLPDALEKRTS